MDNSDDFVWYGTYTYFLYGAIACNRVSLTTTDRDKDFLSSYNCDNIYGAFGWYSTCHDAHFWTKTEAQGLCGSKILDKDGTAVCNIYSNYGPDATESYNTYYQVKDYD